MGRFDEVDIGVEARESDRRAAQKELQSKWAHSAGAEIVREFATAATGRLRTESVILGKSWPSRPKMQDVLLVHREIQDGGHTDYYISPKGDVAVRPGYKYTTGSVASFGETYAVGRLILEMRPWIGFDTSGRFEFDERTAESQLMQVLVARLESG